MNTPKKVERAIDAWRNVDPRRRLLLGVPAALLIVALLYAGVIEPLQSSSRNLRASLPSLEARRDAVRAQAQELRSQQARPAKAGIAAADGAVVRAALARHRLAELQPVVEPKGENRTRLHLPRAPFFAIWPLFQTLQSEHGIRIVSLRIDKLDPSNARVEAMLAAGER